MSIIGDRLKKQRLNKQLTQSEVADRMHIGRSTYTGWERGNFFPDLDKLISLCKFYNKSADYFLGLDDEASNASLDEEQQRVLDYYDRLNEENQDLIRGQMVQLFKEQENETSRLQSKEIS